MLTLLKEDKLAVEIAESIQKGNLAALKKIINDNPELVQARIIDSKGVSRTLLHVAADWPGHFPNGADTVSILVSAGADVNAGIKSPSNEFAETALHWAASNDDVAVLNALLDCGADIESPGAVFTGGTPMSDAVVFGQWNAARQLLKRGAKTTVWQAAALGLLNKVREFVSANPPLSSEEITNAFWHACHGGHLSVVEYLVEFGADLNWIGYDKKTPLDIARSSGSTEVVRWLDYHGAKSSRSAV